MQIMCEVKNYECVRILCLCIISKSLYLEVPCRVPVGCSIHKLCRSFKTFFKTNEGYFRF